ncbi:hypothetical protein SUGI_0662140 [Cryptomeria japonica]|uniref:WAT1-related protein At1g21890-like n=1 Tax=Cryptomeria japonica TaxID=3369 RepID=UPI002414A6E2|nr:WAT1-related protein At1g21890-like [Cryptomeria japonica]GLJ32877.1 hypothetical protein SUGI_0662140 [Cryptomeria japonica]
MVNMEEFKPHVGQILVQACYAGMNIIVRIALDNGMNNFVFVAYRQALATLVMGPIAYFLERKERPAMTCTTFWQIFLLALCGIAVNQNFYFLGLAYTSSTFASATTNLIPVVTFVMATSFRLERVDLRTKRGQAKVIGTIICVGGAMVMTLYKGSTLGGTLHVLKMSTWLLGALLLFASTLSWSAWLTFQAPVLKKYPAQKSLTALILLLGTIQSAVMALFFEPKVSAWKLKWDMELLSIVYSGVLCSAFAFFVQTYCIHERGPVFAAMFNPLSTILVATLNLLILHVKLHVGSVVGGVLIIVGLYIVLWGKAKDKKDIDPIEYGLKNGSTNNIEDCTVDIKSPLLANEANHQHQSESDTEISH